MSPTVGHAQILLKLSEEYAGEWKMDFNPKKSVSLKFGKSSCNSTFLLNGVNLPKVDEITYLGLPLSTKKNYDFFDEKMRKVEKAFYSLYGLGCKPRHLSPLSIAFVYKQYCQSIIRYGMDCLFLPAKKLDEYNTRQSILLKQAIGLSKYARTTPLLNALNVEKVSEIYMKHKYYFYKQLMNNSLTRAVYLNLDSFYFEKKACKHSFLNQLLNVDTQVGFKCSVEAGKAYLKEIVNKFKDSDQQGLVDSVSFQLVELDRNRGCDEKYATTRNVLSLLLYN
jgi:hypothetical protein